MVEDARSYYKAINQTGLSTVVLPDAEGTDLERDTRASILFVMNERRAQLLGASYYDILAKKFMPATAS